MHFNTAQSRSAWTEQEDELLRQAVSKYGDRAWATVANDVPGRSSKSCSDRWRNFLSPDIEHPRKSPFTEWEVAVVVQAQERYGNNWKAISMLLPGRTNRAVKNLFVGNLKWGARLQEIRNQYLEVGMSLEELLEIKPDHAGGPPRPRTGGHGPTGSGSPTSMRAASTSSAGSAWASDMTEQPLSGSPASAGTHHHHHHSDRRKRGEHGDNGGGQSPQLSKRRRALPSPVVIPHGGLVPGCASYSPTVVPHPGALGPSTGLGLGRPGSPSLLGVADMGPPTSISAIGGMHAGFGLAAVGMDHHPASAPASLMVGSAGPLLSSMGLPYRQRISGNGSDPMAGMLLPVNVGVNISDEGLLEPANGLLGNAGYSCGMGQQQRLQLHSMGSGLQAMGMLARSNSLPGSQGGGFTTLLGMGPQAGMGQPTAMLVGRVSTWHAGCVAPDASVMALGGSTGSGSPFAPFANTPQQQQQQQQPQRILMPGTGLPSLTCATGRPSIKPDPVDGGSGDCGSGHTYGGSTWATDMAAQQQYGQQQQQQLYGTPGQQYGMCVLQQHPAAAAHQRASAAHSAAPGALGLPHVVASQANAVGLAIPGSPPALPPAVLTEMKSNDSAALHHMLDNILDPDDDVLSVPPLDKLLPDTPAHQGQAAGHQVQQSSHLAPATPAAQQQQHQQQHQQQYQQQQQGAGSCGSSYQQHRGLSPLGPQHQQQVHHSSQAMQHHQAQQQMLQPSDPAATAQPMLHMASTHWAGQEAHNSSGIDGQQQQWGGGWHAGQQQQQQQQQAGGDARQQYQINQQLHQENLLLLRRVATMQNKLDLHLQQQGQEQEQDHGSDAAHGAMAGAQPQAGDQQTQQQQQRAGPAAIKAEPGSNEVLSVKPAVADATAAAPTAAAAAPDCVLPPLARALSSRPGSLGGGLSGGGWCPRLGSSGGGLRLSEVGSAGCSLMAVLGKEGSLGGAGLLESCGLGGIGGMDDLMPDMLS